MSYWAVQQPFRPYGLPSMRGELWTCDANGEKLVDLTGDIEVMSVAFNWLDVVKSSLRVSFRDFGKVRSITDYLQPRMVLEWRNADNKVYAIDEPLGQFFYLPPDQDIDEDITLNNIEGLDGTWRLNQLTSDGLRVFQAGTEYGIAAFQLLRDVSPVTLNLPHTLGRTIVSPKTVRPNESLLAAANDLYLAAGYWDIACTRYGKATTYERTTLTDATPGRVVSSALGDVVGDKITKQPDRDGFCNQVYLASNNPEADLDMRSGYKVSIVDPANPYSIVNTDIISKPIVDSRDESFESIRRRAIALLQRSGGLLTRMSIPVLPDPRFDPREVWSIDIKQNDGTVVANGNYFVEQMQFTLTDSSIAQRATVSSIVPLEALA